MAVECAAHHPSSAAAEAQHRKHGDDCYSEDIRPIVRHTRNHLHGIAAVDKAVKVHSPYSSVAVHHGSIAATYLSRH